MRTAVRLLTKRFSKRRLLKQTLIIWIGLSAVPAATLADWPQFRGPNGQGVVAESNAPLEWSESKNVAWKTPIPGRGWSSPVVAGKQVWLTTATDGGRSLRAVCVDRNSGRIVHNIEVLRPLESESIHTQNSHASPTPVIAGDIVIAHFGRNGTACVSTDGNLLWKNQELVYSTPHGGANSPVVHDNLVIVCCDGSDKQFVAALSKSTGQIIWKRDRQHLEDAHRKSAAEKNESRKGLPFIAFSTPLVIDVAGEALLISTPADHVVANRVDTGEEVWWLPYNCFSLVARPVFGNGLVYAIGGLRDGHFALYAIRPAARGQIDDAHLAWQRTESIPHVPSPLLLGDKLLLIKDGGVATCLNAINGEEVWQQRLGGNFRASPIAIGDKVFAPNQEGKTLVFTVGPKYNPLASNQLDGIFLASPAVTKNALYLRSESHLYKIAATASDN